MKASLSSNASRRAVGKGLRRCKVALRACGRNEWVRVRAREWRQCVAAFRQVTLSVISV